jgi:type II secretory pathway pseudopilin PulG
MAIAALVLAFIPVCLNVAGIALGIVSLVRIGRAPRELQGKGLAIAAIAVGCAGFIVAGILSAIAIPNFIRYQSRAKQEEARASLKAIDLARRTAEAESGQPPVDFTELGFAPPDLRRYAYFYGSEELQPTEGGPFQIPAELPGVGDDAVAFAVADIDSDPALDVWVLSADGRIENVVNDLEHER